METQFHSDPDSSASRTVSFSACQIWSAFVIPWVRVKHYTLEKLLQRILFLALNQDSLVVNVFDDEIVAMFCINLDKDSFDRGIALNENA